MDTSPDGLEQARREAQERSLVRSVMERGEPESLADALERRGRRRDNNNNYNSNAFRRKQEERNRIYEQEQQRYKLAEFNKYLKSPEIMLYNAIIKEDINEMSDIMSTHRLTPDSYILYLDNGQELTIEAGRFETSLLKVAFGKKKLSVISFLIDRGANFQQPFYFRGNYATTTLIEAVEADYTDIINQILSKNPPPAFINTNGNVTTALISAVKKGNITYVKQIVQAGANINQSPQDIDSLTPIYIALLLKFYEIADFFRQNGATRPSMRNIIIKYTRVDAEFYHDLESLNWILKNYLSDFGLPRNAYGSETNPEDILFKFVNIKDTRLIYHELFNGSRRYDWGDNENYRKRINLLRPLFNNIDSSGNTALMAAIAANNITLATHLINFGAKTAIQNNEGNTALHFAALNAKGKTGDERTAAIALINKLIDTNQALTKIKNKAGYGPGNPKLTMNAEITKLIHGRKPWLTAKNTNKPPKVGGANTCKRSAYGFKASRVARSPFKTLKAAKKAEAAAKAKKPIGFTATSSLKAMGRMARSNGCYTLGPKYE
jgi:ankyrin repeat protein